MRAVSGATTSARCFWLVAPAEPPEGAKATGAAVATRARAGDLVLTLGAGSIAAVGDRILAALRARPEVS